MSATSIETYSGRFFDYKRMDKADIDVESIAHALGNICRYTGHVREFYSVAEHCLLCMALAVKRGLSPRIQMLALVHDAHEAYVGDINHPLKISFNGGFGEIDDRAFDLTLDVLGVSLPNGEELAAVKILDLVALATEARDLMPSGGVGWNIPEPDSTTLLMLAPKEASKQWLKAYTMMSTGSGSIPSR